MVSKGVLVKLEAKPGLDTEVEELLQSLAIVVRQEPETFWFALRFGRTEYGIFAAFPDDEALEAHLEGSAGRSLYKAGAILRLTPHFHRCTVISHKLPVRETVEPNTKGMFLQFQGRERHEEGIEELLFSAAAMARDEERTSVWFSLRFASGEYGMFAAFHDNGGRIAHLSGHIMRELAKHPFSYMGSIPDLELVNILVEKICVER